MRLITSDNPRPLYLLAFGPDGLLAAARGLTDVGGQREALEAWEPATGERRFALDAPAGRPPTGLVGLADRFLAAPHDPNEPSLWAVAPDGRAAAVAVFEWWPMNLAAAAGRVLANTYDGRAWARLECLADEGGVLRPLWRTEHDERVWCRSPALSPDGTRAAVGVSGQSDRPAQHIALLDGHTGTELRRITLDPADPVRQLAFTADSKALVAQFDSRTVRLFDATTGAAKGELTHKGRPYVTAIAAHPGGHVACARTDGTVSFWDPHTRQVLRTLDWKAGGLVSLSFSLDGALGAAGTANGQVVVWDVDV